MEEHRFNPNSWFFTLTYSDECVPFDETISFPVVRKRDIQLFMKRLRKRFSSYGITIRFFLCSEYGPKTLRPHYHGILFGIPPSKGSIYFNKVFISALISDSWKQGFITVDPVSPARCFYVAKYCSSVSVLPDHLKDVRYKPFLLCSRKPGIGFSYLEHREARSLRLNPASFVRREGGSRVRIPRYLKDRLYDSDMRDRLKAITLEYSYAKSYELYEQWNLYSSESLYRLLSYELEFIESIERKLRNSSLNKSKL